MTTQQTGTAAGTTPVSAVVAALDGSERDASVLVWAARAARRHGVPLDLVRVVDPGPSTVTYDVLASGSPDFARRLEAVAAASLDDAVRSAAQDHPELEIHTDVRWGSPVAGLVEASERGILVLGATTRRGWERAVLGSTALALVAHSRGTVVVVPTGDEPATSGPDVVVGVDGSPAGLRAVAHAVWEAKASGGSVVAVIAWHVEVDEGVVVTEPGSPRWQRVEGRLGDLARSVVHAADGPDTTAEVVVRHGTPVEALLQVAEEQGAGLVVVGSRGRGGFTGLLLGSVSRSLVQHSRIPVAVVR